MPQKKVSQIIKEVCSIKSKAKKIEALRSYGDNAGVLAVLTGAFDDRVKWLLPEGPAPYKPNEITHDLEGIFYNEVRKLYLYIEGGNDALGKVKRELLFIEMLERLDPEDAEMMVHVKDKSLPYKGLNADIVREALPGLLPDG